MQGQETRTILIIGGSGGIGASICRALALPHNKLYVHGGRDAKKLQDLAEELSPRCASVETLLYELGSSSELTRFVDHVSNWVQPDILICAFGPMLTADLEHTDPAGWDRMIACNLLLPSLLTSRFLPGMRERLFGRFVYFGLSGKGQIEGYRECPAYATAKHGLQILAKSIAKSYTKDGICALVFCPGYVDTEYLSEETKLQLRKRTPEGKLQQPEDLAQLLAFLLSKSAFLLNGATIEAGSGI